MLTVNVRSFLIILFVLIGFFLFLFDISKKKKFRKRCLTFVKFTIFGFPLIDLPMVPGELNIKVFEFVTIIFFLINFQSFVSLKKKKQNTLVYLFFFVLILTAVTSYFIGNSFYEIIKFSSYFILFIILRTTIKKDKKIPNFLFNGIVIWLILFFIFQILFGIDFSFYKSLNEISISEFRFTSFSQDPQKMSQLAYMLSIIFLGKYLIKTGNSLKNIIFFSLTLIVGLSSGSKASLIGFFIALIIIMFYKVSFRSSILILLGFLLIIFFYDSIQALPIFSRMLDLQESFDVRANLFWLEALNIFYKYPVFGIGFGNFPLYVQYYADYLTYGNDVIIDQPESGFLLWLVETGSLGFTMYILILFKIMKFKNRVKDTLHYKLSLLVWMMGFVSVYSFSDIKVLYLIVLIIAIILSDNLSIKKIRVEYKT